MLLNLPTEILQSLFQWFQSNQESIALIKTCKEWKNITKNHGYIRKLSFPIQSGLNWINTFCNHPNTIDRVYIYNQTDPHFWIFKFPRIVNCCDCNLTTPFIPNGGTPCDTETLIFRNMLDPYMTKFKTNWELFPKLRTLIIYVYDCDVDGLEKLKDLYTVAVYTYWGCYKKCDDGDIKFFPKQNY